MLAGIFAVINLHTHTGGTGAREGLSWLARLGLMPENVWTYLRLVFWPVRLAVLYPEHDIVHAGRALAALAGLGILTGAALWQGRRRPYLAVGWLWFLAALLPVLRGVRMGNAAYADRFTYLPAIGLAVALVWGLGEAADRLSGRWPRRLVPAAAALLVAGLAVMTRIQTRVWRDSESLFRHALAATTGNAGIHYNLATVLVRNGRGREAAEHFRAVLELGDPNHVASMNNLAWLLAADPDSTEAERREAVEWATRALKTAGERHPDLLNTLERAQAAAGDYEAAIATAEEGLALAEREGNGESVNKIRWRMGTYRTMQRRAEGER